MSVAPWFAVLALSSVLAGEAFGQGIYTCVDAKGRRLTADRPIAECMDREQKQLNKNGTVVRIVPPVPTAVERAALEERERKATEERQRAADEKRSQRALLARYPNAAAHEAERAKAMRGPDAAIASAQRRIQELQEQPASDERSQHMAAQQRYIATQQEEKRRITRRFDEDLAKLKLMWAEQAAAAAGAAGAASAVRR